MPRLSDIPPETLKQIEQYVKEMKGKVPVTSAPKPDGTKIKTLVDLVEEKFGYRLSPSQIYSLQKGERIYRIKLETDVVIELEKKFGSVGKGVKEVLKAYKAGRVPAHLEQPYRVLLRKKELTSREIEELLEPFVEESDLWNSAWDIIRELAKHGVVFKQGDKFVVSTVRRDPLAELLFGF